MRPSLAVSMIVRDAAARLPACLASVRDIADEIVVADTGSCDETIAIAKDVGARVISIPWNDNFAEARNRALAAVNSDWVLSLDADEQLDASAASAMTSLLADNSTDAYQVTIRNYVLSLEDRIWDRAAIPNNSSLAAARGYPAYVEHENVRLFRRTPEIYFVGRVHESVGPRVLETGRKLGRAPFFIHHFGLVADAETRARKNHFYCQLGQQKIREMPRDAQAHFELGLVELDNFQNLEKALELFTRACELNRNLGVARFFRGLTLLKLEKPEEALSCLREAEQLGHDTALVQETMGDAHYQLKQFSQSCRSYRKGLEHDSGNVSLQSKLGLTTIRDGNAASGLRMVRDALATKLAARDLHDRLVLSLVWLDRIDEAAEAASAKLRSVGKPESGDFLRAASLWAKTGNWDRAVAALGDGLRFYPNNVGLERAMEEAKLAV
ncbi:MAG TPA: glycosyltransferase [Candidatus Acidoferrum sp.]|jgi:tetratricopeptide (TPR) repeat protein